MTDMINTDGAILKTDEVGGVRKSIQSQTHFFPALTFAHLALAAALILALAAALIVNFFFAGLVEVLAAGLAALIFAHLAF